MHNDRPMVRSATRQHRDHLTGQTPYKASIETKGHQLGHGMSRQPWTDVDETREEGRAYKVVVADNCGTFRQAFLDTAQLPPVEGLAM